MQRSLTILSSVAALLTLFITSKLVIPNVHERDVSGYELQGTSPCGFQRMQRACNALLAFNLGMVVLRIETDGRKNLILLNPLKKEKEIKISSLNDEISDAYQFYARCSGYNFRSCFLSLSLSLARMRLLFSRVFQWWNIVENMSRWIYSLSKQQTHAIMTYCPFLMIATFFLRFAEKRNPLDRFDLLDLFRKIKVAVVSLFARVMIDIFLAFRWETKFAFLSFRSDGSMPLDKNGMMVLKGLSFISNSLSEWPIQLGEWSKVPHIIT